MQVQEEIIKALRLGAAPGPGLVRAVTSFDRPNLHYEAMERAGSLGSNRALADAVARCRCAVVAAARRTRPQFRFRSAVWRRVVTW